MDKVFFAFIAFIIIAVLICMFCKKETKPLQAEEFIPSYLPSAF